MQYTNTMYIYLQIVKRTNTLFVCDTNQLPSVHSGTRMWKSAIGAIDLITVFPIPPKGFAHMWCRKKVYAVQVGECVDTIAADAANMVHILKQMYLRS